MPRKAAAPVVDEVVSNGPVVDETPAVPEAAPAPVVESGDEVIIDYAQVMPGYKGKARTASGAIVEYL